MIDTALIAEKLKEFGYQQRYLERKIGWLMSFDRDIRQWKCGKAGVVNLQKVSSIVRDIGEPCLHQSSIKVVITVRFLNLSYFSFSLFCLLVLFCFVLFFGCFFLSQKHLYPPSIFIGLFEYVHWEMCVIVSIFALRLISWSQYYSWLIYFLVLTIC